MNVNDVSSHGQWIFTRSLRLNAARRNEAFDLCHSGDFDACTRSPTTLQKSGPSAPSVIAHKRSFERVAQFARERTLMAAKITLANHLIGLRQQ